MFRHVAIRHKRLAALHATAFLVVHARRETMPRLAGVGTEPIVAGDFGCEWIAALLADELSDALESTLKILVVATVPRSALC